MKNRIHFSIVLIVSYLGLTFQAAGLIQELNLFSVKLTNLAKKITSLPPAGEPVIPPPPVTKPKKPDEQPPKFIKPTYFINYGEDSTGSSMQIKVGLVEGIFIGIDKDYDLIVHGPELTNAKPEDFIVQKTQTILGPGGIFVQIKVDRLSFPIDKADDITWSINNKILNKGRLANFVLVKAADYRALKEQQKEIRDFRIRMLSSIIAAIGEVSGTMPGGSGLFLNEFTAQGWLDKVKRATDLCSQILEKGFPNIFQEEINKLGEQTIRIIDLSLIKAKSMPKIEKALTEEKNKLDVCLKNFAILQKKPSLENVLYKFYEAYLAANREGSTLKTSDWWVVTERKIKEPEKPVIPVTPVIPVGPKVSAEKFADIVTFLESKFNNYKTDYKTKTEAEREKFVMTESPYEKSPDEKMTIKDLLAYYMRTVDLDYVNTDLQNWNKHIVVGDYSWTPSS